MSFWVFGIYNLFRTGLIRALCGAFEPGETGRAVLVGAGLVFCALSAYLLGSVNWALVISKLVYHDDVRNHGSGNAGTTNVLRTYGRKAAALTFLGDGLKGVLAIVIACLIFGYPLEDGYYIFLITAAYLSAFFCIIGHIFPCFSHFRGGKGFATAVGCILALNPVVFLILSLVFFPLVLGTHYVSLGSVVTVWMYSLILASFDSAFSHYGISVIFAILIALLVTWSHRTNLRRLFNHQENKTYFFKKKSEAGKENK